MTVVRGLPGILWLLLLVVACSSGGDGDSQVDDGSIVGPGDQEPPAEARRGTVQLDNRTTYAIGVAYLHRDENGERIYRVDIGAGVSAPISDGDLAAHTEVVFDLVLQVPDSLGLRVRRKARVTIEADLTIVAALSDSADQFSLRIAGS